MKRDEYLAKLPPPSTPRDERHRRSTLSLLRKLEGRVGPLDLPAAQWDDLVSTLFRYTRHDWIRVRKHGDAAIPQLQKPKKRKPQPKPPKPEPPQE